MSLLPKRSRATPRKCREFGRNLTARKGCFYCNINYLVAGWGARIRTWEWRNQNPLPYHLATPHSRAPAAIRLRDGTRADHTGMTGADQSPAWAVSRASMCHHLAAADRARLRRVRASARPFVTTRPGRASTAPSTRPFTLTRQACTPSIIRACWDGRQPDTRPKPSRR
jgi:hypothetical protein